MSKTEGGARKEEPVEDDTLVGALMKALNDRAKSLRSGGWVGRGCGGFAVTRGMFLRFWGGRGKEGG